MRLHYTTTSTFSALFIFVSYGIIDKTINQLNESFVLGQYYPYTIEMFTVPRSSVPFELSSK